MSHKKVWEDHHGRKRKLGWHIHHIDGNHSNNAPANLFHCSPKRHARLHRDMGQHNASNLILKHSADTSGENHPLWGRFGEDNPSYGQKRPQQSEFMKGNSYSKGHKMSEEGKKSLSEFRKTVVSPKKGKPDSEETKKLKSEAAKLRWFKYRSKSC